MTPSSSRGTPEPDGLRWWDTLLLPLICLGALVLIGTLADLARALVGALG